MVNYLLINCILSLSALTINRWLRIPHRIRFYTLMVAVMAWLTPFGLIHIELNEQSTHTLPLQVLQFSQPLLSANQVIEQNHDFSYILAVLFMVGALLLIRDMVSSHYLVKNCKSTAVPITKNPTVRFTTIINGAFVSGYFKPTIWISQNLHKDCLDTVITHEKQHIMNHDQFWLLAITCVHRLMWFNPLAYLLCQKTRQAIELSCDEQCKLKLGRAKYQTQLAQILVHNSQAQNMLLHNPINHRNKFNINRIEQLNQDNHMTKTTTSKFIMIALSALLMTTIALVTIAKDTSIPVIQDHQVMLTLKVQHQNKQIKEFSILTNQGEMAHVTYDNHDFGFTTQVMPEEPAQVYTDIVISEVKNGLKNEISNPGIVTYNTQWGAFKFGEGDRYFNIEIMAKTSSKMSPIAEMVKHEVEKNNPIPTLVAAPALPEKPIAPKVSSAVNPVTIDQAPAIPKVLKSPIPQSAPIPQPAPVPDKPPVPDKQ